jgi:hypothetical protein
VLALASWNRRDRRRRRRRRRRCVRKERGEKKRLLNKPYTESFNFVYYKYKKDS